MHRVTARPTRAASSVHADADFAFSPDSMIWRVCRERCNLLDGGAAAVLQVAHPKVAAGVRDHSDFRTDTYGRLMRTLDGVNTIVFGTRDEADAMATRISARHRNVRGRVCSTGETYSADDPELLMWVIATLVVAALVGYERALPRLTDAEREAFYCEMRQFGTWFGLPAEFGPQTWEQFGAYWERMLADEQMGATASSKVVARAVAQPEKPWWMRLAAPPARFAFSEILPDLIRERLGFRRTLWTRAAMHVVERVLPWVVPVLPSRLRYCPQYLAAREKLGASVCETLTLSTPLLPSRSTHSG